jgi:hypothetical protein
MRAIVARDGTGDMPWAASRPAMLNGPLNSPASASSLRTRTTASSTSAGVAIAITPGRRERSRSPSKPSSSNRFFHL